MATVKGDVHDIGKNIVGVVLQCNNYDVIDLGVMVPAQKILDAAQEHDADIIGLSGLITPSLDEMVNFAGEMERLGLELPLLIGGATTSRAHTAVKVDKQYHGPVVWVKDASRSVQIVAALLSSERRDALLEEMKADYDSLRARHAARTNEKALVSYAAAQANRTPIDWSDYRPTRPHMIVQQARDTHTDDFHPSKTPLQFVKTFHDYSLAELREYIDWQPFFNAWEMKGRYPDILNNPTSGEAARKLWEDAQRMLDRIIDERWLRAAGVIGLFPANAVGDDIEVYTDESRTSVRTVLHEVRQQTEHREGVPHRSLADFVAPSDTGLRDYVGAFAVTAGLGSAEKAAQFKAELDDYSAILLESRTRANGVLGLPARRGLRQRGAAQGALRRHPAGARISGVPGAHREADLVGVAGREGERRHRTHREHGHVAGRLGVWRVLLTPAVAVLRRRPARP
jgi:5-methyltetrahydrofolate--homocysteine methyltransferase